MIFSEQRKKHIKSIIDIFCRDYKDIDADNLYDYIISSSEFCIPDSYVPDYSNDFLEDTVYIWILTELGQLGSLSYMMSKIQDPNLMISNMLRGICNSIYSVLHLSINGLDYSAKILLRVLMEQYMILLSITADQEKRNAYINSWEDDEATDTWYKNFTKKKFINLISKYFDNTKIDQKDIADWVDEKYSHYSGYVHNDYAKVFLWSYVNLQGDELKPNVCGEYVTRKYELLFDCFFITLCFDMMFWNMISDSNVDIDIDTLLNNNSHYIQTTLDTNKFKFWLGLLIVEIKRKENL